MASYKVVIDTRAAKDIRKLPPTIRQRITLAIEGLSTDPQPLAATKLVGSSALRLRVGDYRIIYEIEHHKIIIYIIRVRHRKEVYKN